MEENKVTSGSETASQPQQKQEATYTQSQVNDIVAEAKNRVRSKMVEPAEYEKLVNELNEYKNKERLNSLKSEYQNLGGNEKFFDDFLKINPNIDASNIKDAMNKSAWVFMKDGITHNFQKELGLPKEPVKNIESMSLYEFADIYEAANKKNKER